MLVVYMPVNLIFCNLILSGIVIKNIAVRLKIIDLPSVRSLSLSSPCGRNDKAFNGFKMDESFNSTIMI